MSEELDGIDDGAVDEVGDPACWADEFTEYLGLDGAEQGSADDQDSGPKAAG